MSNQIKDKLARGEIVIKISPRFPHPRLIEFIGSLGFDAVFLDCEHGNLTIQMVEDLARAARVAGISAIVRPEDDQRHMILRYLDVEGVTGVMVPHIHTVEDARRVAEAASYGRFKDASYRDPGMWRAEDKLIVALIESPEGVRNLPEMVKLPGIDVFFIGPNDLSNGMGYPGQYDHPEVVKVRDYAMKTILDSGKTLGTLASYENVEALIERGVTYMLMPATAFLKRGATEFQELAKRRPKALAR